MSNSKDGFDPHGTYFRFWNSDSGSVRRPLVLIHGVGLDHQMWDWQLPTLRGQVPVLCYDLLGHGRTPVDEQASQLADFVAQLDSLLDHLKLDTIHLAGFSLGALIAQLFCRHNAERLASVAFLNGVYRRVDPEFDGVRERLRLTREHGAGATAEMAVERWFTESYRHAHPDIMEQVRARLLANDLNGYVTAYSCFVNGDREVGDALRHISCPALAMTAENDVGSTPQMCERMAADLADPTIKVIPQLRHGAPIEGADMMAGALLDFIAVAEQRAT